MTTYAFGDLSITPNRAMMGIVAKTGSLPASPYSSYVQSFGRSGAIWRVTLGFQNLQYADAQKLQAFFAQLHGQEHRFTVKDYHYQQSGVMTGTPLVKGASQTGTTLETDGWTNGITLKAGNRISFVNGNGHRELKIITADTTVDGSGNASIPVYPDIHTAPDDNESIVVADPLGTFKLSGQAVEWSNEPGDWTSFEIQGIEDSP